MSPHIATVLAAAEQLSAAERRELIELLTAGLEDPSPEGAGSGPPTLTDSWRRAVAQRSEEYDAGRAETVTWQEVQARWRSRRSAGG
jgi:putative addiction module component (TIGR02574 family)